MIQRPIQMGMILLAILCLAFPLSLACGDDDDKTPATATPAPTAPVPGPTEPEEDVTITIGNLTDLTGVSSAAQQVINMAMKDMANYYNENNLIPGVEVEVIEYDGGFDPSKDIPGWEWLREHGADMIFTAVPPAVVTLQPLADSEKFVLFSATAGLETLTPPGYLFSLGTIPQWEVYTLLKWIAENDWDYEANGPAKIGGAAWEEPLVIQFFTAMEEYAEAHPDQFEFVGGHFAPLGTFTWGPEIEALKDADYVYPCTACLASFGKQYRDAGGLGKLIGDGPHLTFMHLVDDSRAWDEIDGMLFVAATKWWNEDGELIDLTKQLLHENHPESAQEIIRTGAGYLASYIPYIMLNIIANAVEAVGPENFDSQALYDAAASFSLIVDDLELYGFADKRSVSNYYNILEAREAGEDLFPVSGYLPIFTAP